MELVIGMVLGAGTRPAPCGSWQILARLLNYIPKSRLMLAQEWQLQEGKVAENARHSNAELVATDFVQNKHMVHVKNNKKTTPLIWGRKTHNEKAPRTSYRNTRPKTETTPFFKAFLRLAHIRKSFGGKCHALPHACFATKVATPRCLD
eukprot:3757333-Amphidinium_carterae.2